MCRMGAAELFRRYSHTVAACRSQDTEKIPATILSGRIAYGEDEKELDLGLATFVKGGNSQFRGCFFEAFETDVAS